MILFKYEVTVKDDFFDKELTGEFFAPNEGDAMDQAADYYAMELDTNPDMIEIINCKLVS